VNWLLAVSIHKWLFVQSLRHPQNIQDVPLVKNSSFLDHGQTALFVGDTP
jgi:hypothetical protein